MTTPSIPSGFKPVVQGYSVGAPGGVRMTEVEGGLPRVAMQWDRGYQPFQVSLVISRQKFSIWTTFFHRVIQKGAIQFTMPIDSGFGLSDHLCIMDTSTYSAVPVRSAKHWSVSFVVLAENQAYEMTEDEAAAMLDLWELYGDDLADVLARIERLATVDSLVLTP